MSYLSIRCPRIRSLDTCRYWTSRSSEPENVDELVAGLKSMRASEGLRQEYRDNGLSAAKEYDRKELAREMLGLLEETVRAHKRGVVNKG